MPAPHHVSWDRDRPATNGMNIRRAAECRLQDSGDTVVWDVGCDLEPGVLRLRNTLATHYLKQVAQALVAYVEGVHIVINQMEVGDSVRGKSVRGRESSAKTETPFQIPGFHTKGESHDAGH